MSSGRAASSETDPQARHGLGQARHALLVGGQEGESLLGGKRLHPDGQRRRHDRGVRAVVGEQARAPLDVVAIGDQVRRLGLHAQRPAADDPTHVGCAAPAGEGGDQRLGPEVLVNVDPHVHTNTIFSTNLMENSSADAILGAAVAFLLAVVTTPVGVSGAVLLLPFQASVLKVATPALTPTNLLYNVVTTPGALVRLAQENRLGSPLVGRLLTGALPGIAVGAVARVEFLPGRDALYAIAALVLLPLGLWLLVPQRERRAGDARPSRAGGTRLHGGGDRRALRNRRAAR